MATKKENPFISPFKSALICTLHTEDMHGLIFEKRFFYEKRARAKHDLSALKTTRTGLCLCATPATRVQNLFQKILLAIFHARAERDFFGAMLASVEARLQLIESGEKANALMLGSAPRRCAFMPLLAAQN